MSLQRVLQAPQSDGNIRVTKVHVASSSKIFFATQLDGADFRIWFFDLDVSNEPFILREHTRAVISLATEGQYLLSGAYDKVVLWDLSQRLPIRSFIYPPTSANSVLFWDEHTVISGHYDKLIRIWNRNTADCRIVLSGHTYAYGVKLITRYKNFLVSVSDDIRMWDVSKGECIRRFDSGTVLISNIATIKGMMIASCYDHTAKVWDLDSSELLHTLKGHNAVLGHVKADGNYIATGAADGSMGIWSQDTFELIHYIPLHHIEDPRCTKGGCIGGVIGFNFEDGILIASGWEGVVKAGRLESFPQLKTLGEPFRLVWNLKVCGSKAYVVVSIDGLVCVEIWDLKDLEAIPIT